MSLPIVTSAENRQELLRQRAQEYLEAGQFELAEELFRQLTTEAPHDVAAWNGWLRSLLAQQRLQEAYQTAQQLTQQWELYVPAKIWLAFIAEHAQQPTEARRHLEDAVRHVPEDPAAKVALFEHFFRAEDWPEAELVLRELLRQHPDYAPALCNLGTVLLRQGHLEQAREVYWRVVQRDPENTLAQENLDYLQHVVGRTEG